ncbi:negative elongation factor B-like [Rhipicephalus microplus]|uniref:negative elongation factor B-like n=1 Tax=Rhipicephalus microplus TaxID=6941 RepID=UPI003F6D0591
MNRREQACLPGREALRVALTNCVNPLQAIQEFQEENGVLLPSLRPALSLLDLHGVRRLDFHTSLREELKGRLMQQIETLANEKGREQQKKLEEMLERSFHFIKVPTLRPVVMCLLRNTKCIDQKYMRLLVSDKSLYRECDIEVRRQIWLDNKELFAEEVLPLLSEYVSEREEALWGLTVTAESPFAFFKPTPKQRRQRGMLQRLLAMVNRNLVLYDMLVEILRAAFRQTRNVHYCTLRVELLMALHDLEAQEITAVDRTHKFTWCLDACIREKNMDEKRCRELQSILEVKRGQEELLCDLGLALCDPHAINFLGHSAVKAMIHLVNLEAMPRGNHVLVLLLRMLALGIEAWKMLSTEVYAEPALDVQLFTRFIPALMCLMIDDQMRLLSSRLKENDEGSPSATADPSEPIPDAFQEYVKGNALASTLALFYVLHLARQRDHTGLVRVLCKLAETEGRRAYKDPFLHSLVGHLTNMAHHFAREDFCMVVFDDFLLRGLKSSALKGDTQKSNRHAKKMTKTPARHLMRLLWQVHGSLPPARLNNLMNKLQPFAEVIEELKAPFQALEEKIDRVNLQAAAPGSADIPLPRSPAMVPM